MNLAPRFLSLAALVASACHASTVFNFDNDLPGTTTKFTDTVNALSASFSSSGDPGGFIILPSIYETLTGNVLGSPGPAQLDNLTLTIAFSQPLNALTLDFATSDFTTPSPLTLNAYENAAPVGHTKATGQFLNGFTFPEGEIAFSGTSFNQVVLSSNVTDFAIDNITVNTAPTAPEPADAALLGLGAIAIALPGLLRARRGAQAK